MHHSEEAIYFSWTRAMTGLFAYIAVVIIIASPFIF